MPLIYFFKISAKFTRIVSSCFRFLRDFCSFSCKFSVRHALLLFYTPAKVSCNRSCKPRLQKSFLHVTASFSQPSVRLTVERWEIRRRRRRGVHEHRKPAKQQLG